MHYLDRKTINSRLRFAPRQSFRIVGTAAANAMRLIPSSAIVQLLNSVAWHEDAVSEIPFDILTADEIAQETGIPARRILLATRRRKAPLPHYHFNDWTIRIRRSSWERWLNRGSRNMGKRKEGNS